jgi:hypothetical protein
VTHDHVTETPGRLRIDGKIGAARLFGLPFLLIGLWFLMQFLGGARDVLRGQVHFGDSVAGLVGILFMAAVFGLPGFLIFFLRRYVALDAGTQLVEEVKDFLVTRSVRVMPFSDFREVLVRWEESNGSGGQRNEKSIWLATVRLVRTDGKDFFLSHDTNGSASLDLGKKAAAIMQLPLRDETARTDETEE